MRRTLISKLVTRLYFDGQFHKPIKAKLVNLSSSLDLRDSEGPSQLHVMPYNILKFICNANITIKHKNNIKNYIKI